MRFVVLFNEIRLQFINNKVGGKILECRFFSFSKSFNIVYAMEFIVFGLEA
jgi:hypothetical protein